MDDIFTVNTLRGRGSLIAYVESATTLLGRTKSTCALKEWGLRLAAKKGISKARVAVARRLSELLFTLWGTERSFDASVKAPSEVDSAE